MHLKIKFEIHIERFNSASLTDYWGMVKFTESSMRQEAVNSGLFPVAL